MEIKRCYPLAIRISSWGAYDGLDFNKRESLDEAMKEAHAFYCVSMHYDNTTYPAHVTVNQSDKWNGTYRINADGTYVKLSDTFMTLEEICASK